ncbi:tolA protein-like protein [Chlamydia pneumoniae LPCoLN]|uniref:inclusion-associated protein n=1 Tax=Chlamydia pneumoniae TaxID=83558 RepID=UPI0001BD9D0C|nr:inclusion-associated protein [Chlamydia pneumoniae]ACZ32672.1 tolA protein-like protein [Chlamydia pneumoniae LPCoLN]
MMKYLPYIAITACIHGGILLLVFASPLPKKRLQPKAFQEKLVTIQPKPPVPTPSVVVDPAKTIRPSVATQPQQQAKCSPPQENVQKALKKPIPKVVKTEPPKPSPAPTVAKKTTATEKPPPSTTKKNTQLSKTQLQTLSEVAQALFLHVDKIEKSETSLKNISWPSTAQLTMHSELKATQEDELCELFRTHIALPSKGYVRIKLVLSPNGEIQECSFLSEVSAADKQLLTQRIQALPFQKFLEKYKVSKNISFHIKLVSNES